MSARSRARPWFADFRLALAHAGPETNTWAVRLWLLETEAIIRADLFALQEQAAALTFPYGLPLNADHPHTRP